VKRLLCIVAMMAAVPVGAKKPVPVPSLDEIIRVTVNDAFNAIDERDYPRAHTGLLAAQAVLDQRPLDGDTFDDRAVRSVVAYLTAKAAGEGKLGDPCPILKRAQSLFDTATVLAAKQLNADDIRKVSTNANADIAAANIQYRCGKAPLAEKGTIPAKLAGHYYLSGIMETGSELLLKPDGAYEYYITYGAVDEFSRGTWQRIGDAVVLTHTKTPTGGPLFKLDSLELWDAGAEDYVQTARHEARVKVVEAACPFLAEPDMDNVAFSPPMVTTDATVIPGATPPKVDDTLIYLRAKATEEQARQTYERAVQVAMVPANTNAGRHDTARDARYIWQSALVDLQIARNSTDSEEPLPPTPKLPAICKFPAAIAASDIPEKDWVRGFGVIVGDPVAGAKFSNVTVRFHFADGRATDTKTQRRGFAWVEKRAGNPVTAISLSYQRGMDQQNSPFERFPIRNGTEGVQRVIIDSRQLVAPPFDEMRLEITDKGLSRPNGRGLYSKD
jgi:hypothetical protein